MFKHSVKLGPFKVPLSGYAHTRNTLKVKPAVLNHLSIFRGIFLNFKNLSFNEITHTNNKSVNKKAILFVIPRTNQ